MLDPGLFTAEAREARLPGKVQEMGKSLAPLGPLKSFDLIGREDADGIRVHSYRGVIGDTATILTFVVTGDGKIAGLSVVPE
jgi:hypothetical protein